MLRPLQIAGGLARVRVRAGLSLAVEAGFRMKSQHCVAWSLAGLLAVPSLAAAQNVTDPSETARLHLGPLSMTPRFGLRNLGIDTNVFNLSEEPERDFTTTMSGGSDAWLRLGRAYFASKTMVDWYYFQKASSQRSFNVSQEGRVDVDLLRVVPRFGGAFLNTRQRPNDEIDLRVQQRNTLAFVGVMVPVGSRGRIDAEVREQKYDYAVGSHGDADVASALNRTARIATLSGGLDLTPLTRLVVNAEMREDRFTFASERDSDSFRLMPGVEMQPFALISGKAFVGFRKFETPSPTVPDLTRVVASVELRFVAADAFRLTGKVDRDLDYSLDLEESIYVSTSAGLEALQALNLDWDVVGRLRVASLAYQQTEIGSGRVDRVRQAGVGLGRRLGAELRVGFDVDYVTRSSARGGRSYDGFRYGASVTYGY